MNYNIENNEPPHAALAALLSLLFWVIVIAMFVLASVSAEAKPRPRWKRIFKREHRPRYDKYDKDGLLKSSTPYTLDKKKSRKVKHTL